MAVNTYSMKKDWNKKISAHFSVYEFACSDHSDGKLVNGRYRVTNLESRIGKYPISVNVSGYVEPSDVELI